MSDQSSTIEQRLWNYGNVERNDGVFHGDCVEQLTYLLFLQIVDENVGQLKRKSTIPSDLKWKSLLRLDGYDLEGHYRPAIVYPLNDLSIAKRLRSTTYPAAATILGILAIAMIWVA